MDAFFKYGNLWQTRGILNVGDVGQPIRCAVKLVTDLLLNDAAGFGDEIACALSADKLFAACRQRGIGLTLGRLGGGKFRLGAAQIICGLLAHSFGGLQGIGQRVTLFCQRIWHG